MITAKSWMSEETKRRLRAAKFMQDTLSLVDIAENENQASSALDLVEHLSEQIAERGLAAQSDIINKACH